MLQVEEVGMMAPRLVELSLQQAQLADVVVFGSVVYPAIVIELYRNALIKTLNNKPVHSLSDLHGR